MCSHQSRSTMEDMEQPIDCKNKLLVDSGAAFSSECNTKIAHDIAKAKSAMQMTTNAGGSILNEHGEMFGLKHKMWVNEDGTANVASSGGFSDKHHAHFNNAEEDAFIV